MVTSKKEHTREDTEAEKNKIENNHRKVMYHQGVDRDKNNYPLLLHYWKD